MYICRRYQRQNQIRSSKPLCIPFFVYMSVRIPEGLRAEGCNLLKLREQEEVNGREAHPSIYVCTYVSIYVHTYVCICTYVRKYIFIYNNFNLKYFFD